MGRLSVISRLFSALMLHIVGAGLAAPTLLVTRPVAVPVSWLPVDNQSFYHLAKGEVRNLELDTSLLLQSQVYITVMPCARDFHLALYHGVVGDRHLRLVKEHTGTETTTTLVVVSPRDKYILQLSSSQGGSVVVSVRGEPPRHVRLRLRVRSKRRLLANWDPSPIDPQSTTYCVVASYIKNYTSLCSAQHEVKIKRLYLKSNQKSNKLENRFKESKEALDELDNRSRELAVSLEQLGNYSFELGVDENEIDRYTVYGESYRNMLRRKKFGRSTKITSNDPLIACVGERTHHFVENLDPTRNCYVSVFGISQDRRAGSLLAVGTVKPKTSTAKRLKENIPLKSEIKGKTVYYFKTTVGAGGGIWLAVSICGGSVDLEVVVRGKRIFLTRHVDTHNKFFIPAPIPTSSLQETSDEGSVQFDSSSEEARMRFVIKVTPARKDRDSNIAVEVVTSTTRWGINTPELLEDGHSVRELRPRRSCKSVDVAFLPAVHNATHVIRYCITARETKFGDNYCALWKRAIGKSQCVNHIQKSASNVIVQKVHGLKAGRKYTIHVTASNRDSSIPYETLYVDTNASCKGE